MYGPETDEKWQRKWERTGLYRFDGSRPGKKFYCLEMFSYPSGANLHIGHWYNFGLADIYARMKRMQGYSVFHPMGFDAFGLPAENYAIKTGVHPKDSTRRSIETMTGQLKGMGASYDWDYTLSTCDESYYRWTQWLFLKLYHAGLAYRKKAWINWCPSCQTVLANEQAAGGECERCGTPVGRRELTQWFFRITAYADELADSIDALDWPEKTKKIQKNWIGRSEGVRIRFGILDREDSLEVYTTRADTLMGVSYLVMAPGHERTLQITSPERRGAVEGYRRQALLSGEVGRSDAGREMTGVFTGAYAVHPLTGEALPVWVADYVVADSGTGCVMAVPAHDERDYEFAVKYRLPVKQVIDGDGPLPVTGEGRLINSGEFDGMDSLSAVRAVTEKLMAMGMGEPAKNYRLHDWLVSRQRYWGAPIPIVYCPRCGAVPVPEEELPVALPYDVAFMPSGVSPLKSCDEFIHTKCPRCGGDAQRETDTLDTFVCSSWYYLRYPDNRNDCAAFDPEKINGLLPVNKYVGGPEHATMHLLYARFITKVLRDLGYLSFSEPFLSLVHQGNILGADGKRMSKSRPEYTVRPDDYVNEYGADVFRLYLAFGFAYSEGGRWSDDGIHAMVRFVRRVEALADRFPDLPAGGGDDGGKERPAYVLNNTILNVTAGIEKFQFNTAIARIMELTSALEDAVKTGDCGSDWFSMAVRTLILLLAPFAPHLCEELWSRVGGEYSVFDAPWPVHDEAALTPRTVSIAVQINGKVRTVIELPAGSGEEQARKKALDDKAIRARIAGKTIRRVIVVPGRVVNIVI